MKTVIYKDKRRPRNETEIYQRAIEKDGRYTFHLTAQLDLTDEERLIVKKYQGGFSKLLSLEEWGGVVDPENVAVFNTCNNRTFVPARIEDLEDLISLPEGLCFRSANIKVISELEDDLRCIISEVQDAMDNIKKYLGQE